MSNNELDMSTASFINDSSSPILPKDIQTSWQPAALEKQRLELQKKQYDPLPLTSIPSTFTFIRGHLRYFLKTSLQFVFKDNNLPLFINIIYHLIAARYLITRPFQTATRYINIPHTPPVRNSIKSQIDRTTTVAINSFRSQGVFHLTLAVLSALALKERRQSAERSALFVLSLTSVGQTWVHLDAYWKHWTKDVYTIKALQEVGGVNIAVMLISTFALFKTARRTGRFI